MGRPIQRRKIQRNGNSLKVYEYDDAMGQHIYVGSISLDDIVKILKARKGYDPT